MIATLSGSTTGVSCKAAYKRRFASLPVHALHVLSKKRALSAPLSSYRVTSAAQYGILRCALRRRRQERGFLDLRQAVMQRRLPREKAAHTRLHRRLNRIRSAARLGSFHRGVVAKRAKTLVS